MKNIVFFAVIVAVASYTHIKSMPVSIDKKLEVTLLKNRESIAHINQTKNIEHTKTFYVDAVRFHNGSILNHYKLGQIGGYTKDFFLDVKSKMEIKEGGEYTFLMQTDDGFRLIIDGNLVCHFDTHRPISLNECSVNLQKGVHSLEIEYYQGFGNQGFIVEYKDAKGRRYYLGEDSQLVKFSLP